MPIVKHTRTAQYPLVAEFVFNFNDGVQYLAALNSPSNDRNPKATVTDLGSKVQPAGMITGVPYTANTNTGSTYFEAFTLPLGAQVIGGEMMIENAYVGPSTATLALQSPQGLSLLAPTSLIATAFTNQPTTLTNAGSDPRVCTMGNATANGLSGVGQVITVSGCTGASAAYNGTFIVDSYTATSVTFTNPNLTTSLTLSGTINATYITPRTALNIPGELTGYGSVSASEFAAGMDVRGVLAFTGGQAATQGRVRVRVMYTIDGRGNEVITT